MRRFTILLASVVASTSMGASPSAEASGTVGGDMTTSTPQVRPGEVVVLHGRLATRLKRPVKLQRRSSSGWVVVARASTSRRGAASFRVPAPSRTGDYRFRLAAPQATVAGKRLSATGTPSVFVRVVTGAVTPALPPPTSPPPLLPVPPPPPLLPVPPPPPPAGSRENPLAINTPFSSSVWGFSVGGTDTDSWPEIAAENMFNDPPPAGWSYVTAPVTVTYRGSGSDSPWLSTYVEFVGSNGVVYTDYSATAWCGVVPDAYGDIPEMYAGGSATGNACAVVPTAYIAGGLWRIRGSYSAAPVFVKIG